MYLSISHERPPDIMARRWSDFSKAGMAAVAEYWNGVYLKLHFKAVNRRRYDIAPRSDKHVRKKVNLAKKGKAKKGGRVSLVFTGLFEEQMRRHGALRAYPTRVTLRKPAASYVTARPRNKRPNMVEEVLQVNPQEDRKLTEVYETTTGRLMEQFRARRTVKI